MTDSPETPFDRIAYAKRVLLAEAAALDVVANRLDAGFTAVADALFACRGRVAVIGVGKSADVGQKTVGTLNSTGTRAYTLDATRAVHGDLGSIHPDDVALLLSHSGESEELLRLLGPLKRLASVVLAITSRADSSLARAANAAIVYGPVSEACPLALAPSSSTTVMLALGDALAFTLLEQRQFTADEFAKFHPAGSLGRKLAIVSDWMRRGDELRLAPQTDTVREVFAKVRHTGRRTGAIMLVDAEGRLAGLFTDSDLARLFENREDRHLDSPIANVMTRSPVVIAPESRVLVALDVLKARKFSELPVVDAEGRPVGMLDITDLIGLDTLPASADSRPPLRLIDRKSAQSMQTPDLTQRAAAIELLLLDVDGVLTDGSVIYTDDGRELKRFHVRDGSGLKLWHAAGKRSAIVSGRSSLAVERRAAELGIFPVLQGRDDKRLAFDAVLSATGLKPEQVCAIGDDLPDVPVLRRCGLAIAVADACREARDAAHYVTTVPGGRGAVRDATEWLLKLQGRWTELTARYTNL